MHCAEVYSGGVGLHVFYKRSRTPAYASDFSFLAAYADLVYQRWPSVQTLSCIRIPVISARFVTFFSR
jgi:hypothetical protein